MTAWILASIVAIGFGAMAVRIFWQMYGANRLKKYQKEFNDSQYSN